MRVPLLLGVACLVILLLGVLSRKDKHVEALETSRAAGAKVVQKDSHRANIFSSVAVKHRPQAASPETAEQIVARRLKLFSQKQRGLVHKMADYYKLQVPSDVDRFFDALDAGNWPEAQRLFKSLRDGDYNGAPHDAALKKFWRPIVEAYGAAEQAQMWPAQQFLDYGNGILNSLAPGMVYVGGTDPGCFICTMLNATGDGEEHLTLTQNALADSSYLDYLRFSTDGHLNLPTDAELQAAFTQYSQDAQKRLEHDQQFPDEPKQVRPGEDLTMVDGKVSFKGPISVMSINNLLMQDLVQKNPGQSFAMEESFPMNSTYAGAVPLGPIFALNANGDNTSAITSDSANQAVSYWQNMAQTLSTAPDASSSSATMISYAHDAAAQGNLLANNHYPDQAEQAYQTALQISPSCTDAALGLAKVLADQGRVAQANQVLDTFVQNNPNKSGDVASLRASLGKK